MSLRLKALNEQVVVVTGATSGIGLATARLAAGRGARVVAVARNEAALRGLVDEIRRAGGRAEYAAADVGIEADVRRIAATAVERYGAFDTWINNAGTSVYGLLIDVPTEDHRRVFETNFWGTVYGCNEAARHFRGRKGPSAGAIINVGSILSDVAIPVQGMYCASKHAVKGFTDALRMELEKEGVPVSVTLVKPSSTDTPFPQHARNHMAEEPTLPPPLYEPGVVARAILHCAETAERDVTVGCGGKAVVLAGQASPRWADYAKEVTLFYAQRKGEPPRNPAGTLHATGVGPDLEERGDYRGPVRGSSLYTAASLHPILAVGVAVCAGLAAAALAGGASYARSRT